MRGCGLCADYDSGVRKWSPISCIAIANLRNETTEMWETKGDNTRKRALGNAHSLTKEGFTY